MGTHFLKRIPLPFMTAMKCKRYNVTFSTAHISSVWSQLCVFSLFAALTLKLLESFCHTQILTRKSVMLPSVGTPVALGGFLLLL